MDSDIPEPEESASSSLNAAGVTLPENGDNANNIPEKEDQVPEKESNGGGQGDEQGQGNNENAAPESQKADNEESQIEAENEESQSQIEAENEESQNNEEDEEEQMVSNFPEEDSRSRDSSAVVHGLGDEESRDPVNDETSQSLEPPTTSENSNVDAPKASATEEQLDNPKEGHVEEKSSDSISKPRSVSSKDGDSTQDQIQKNQELDLTTDETLQNFTDDAEGENLTTEVDISAMMEIDIDEGSQDQQTGSVPDIIALDSDDEESRNRENNDAEAVVDQRVFQIDEDENLTELDISSMMQVSMGESTPDTTDYTNPPSNAGSTSSSTTSTSRRPRRAAAAAAAKNIHQISTEEQDRPSVFRHRRKSQEDTEFDPNDEIIALSPAASPSPSGKLQRCHMCRKNVPCTIVVKQFGADLSLCSNTCFNRFRNQGKDSKSKCLPCSKCSLMDEKSLSEAFFWETMNFCSDLCVGRYQIDVGSKCCTCGKTVPWNSLGKYCVRFGSDIRQFCVPQCLEQYKKHARVCCNCQLDIRRVGNVILANITSKNTPKEFCSQDCVDMFCERNAAQQPTRAKPQPQDNCYTCKSHSIVYKEIALNTGNFRTCSETCWISCLESKGISKADKCEMCSKYVNMDLGYTQPVFWVANMSKVFGFCSHVCKNLYILNSRKILSCTSCKVKKYNYDLIEYYSNSSSTYAVCSLACLPKSSDYLANIRQVLYLPPPTSDKSSVNIQPSTVSNYKKRNSVSSNGGMNGTSGFEIQIGNSDNILEILTMDELEAIVEELQRRRPKMRSVMCSAKPKTNTVETQTDVSELNQLRLIPLKTTPEVEKPSTSTDVVADRPTEKESPESEAETTVRLGNVEGTTGKDNDSDSGRTTISTVSCCSDATRKISFDGEDTNKLSRLVPRVDSAAKQQIGLVQQQSNVASFHTNQGLIPPNVNASSSFSSSIVPPVLQKCCSPCQSSACCSPSYSHSPFSLSSSDIPPPPLVHPGPIHPLIPPSPAQSSNLGENYMNSPVRPIGIQASGIHPSPSVAAPSSSVMPIGYGTHSNSMGYSRPALPVTAIAPRQQAAQKRVEFAIRAWKLVFGYTSDPRHITAADLCFKLCELINRGYTSSGQKYTADILLYISLGIQQILTEAKRVDRIFYDNIYYNYVIALTDMAEREHAMGMCGTVDELNFWETMELGANSPGVLLFTLIYLFRKHFGLKTWEMHSALQFGNILLESRYEYGKYIKYLSVIGLPGVFPTSIPENLKDPARCIIKIYEFYCYKSEIRDGPFYKCLRQDYTPRNPWFTMEPLHQRHIYQMLIRASMIKPYDGFS